MTPEQFEKLLKVLTEIAYELHCANMLYKDQQFHATGAKLDEHEQE